MLFSSYSAFSQLSDNFSDGNFSSNPVWNGSNAGADFTIVNGQLRSNSTTPNSNIYLSTQNSLANNCTWEFWVNLQFATSGANYVDVYLISDQADLQATNINGYFVRIGNTDDEISLYKRSGSRTAIVKLIDGVNSSVGTSNNTARIRVTRTAANLFTLERDATGGTSYFTEGTATDASFVSTNSFGVFIQQSTASFVQKHFFDDFKISQLVVDNTPPKVASALATDTLTVEVVFDEPMDSVSAKNVSNYSLSNGYGNPVSASTTTDASKYILKYSRSLATGNYTLTATNVKDRSNNTIAGNNSATFSFIKPYIAKKNDVVINEIFADPSPQIALPALEFIELWNTTSQNISLRNWKYSDATSTAILAADTIHAGEYLIFCAKADTAAFKVYGRTIGISTWPSLNNTGDNLTLKNEHGTIINQVNYTDNWYKDAAKKGGGWTLELIDPAAVCSGIQNWIASKDAKGGTPGNQNSQFKSNTTAESLKLVSASLSDSVTLVLTFNRAIDSLSASLAAKYSVNNGVGAPASTSPLSPDFNTVQLKFNSAIARGNTYRITVNNVTDCIGILINTPLNFADFTFAKRIAKTDILINEVLFNPRPQGVDFVEIYNNSENILDLKELSIATLAKDKDSLVSVHPLTANQLLLNPKEYLVLTTDPDNIKKEYQTTNPNAFLKMPSMPGFNNDAGVVVLLSGGSRIDQLNYNEKMHLPLIKDPDGVSLERSSFSKPTNEPGNFHSAAADVGYATPGYKNSQLSDESSTKEEVFLTSKTFSPDNDGFEDLLQINYNLMKPGAIANATIYSDKGALVHKLAKNLTLSTQGTLTWDGLGEYTGTPPAGIYLLYFEIFDLDGKIRKYRKNFVLAHKF
ncbi:MAG: hypothetical protein K0S09_2092 [Sphingobacteriaceae bacterium]|nr:hypothetical protein [Sphingobacteriaceae bacterium]